MTPSVVLVWSCRAGSCGESARRLRLRRWAVLGSNKWRPYVPRCNATTRDVTKAAQMRGFLVYGASHDVARRNTTSHAENGLVWSRRGPAGRLTRPAAGIDPLRIAGGRRPPSERGQLCTTRCSSCSASSPPAHSRSAWRRIARTTLPPPALDLAAPTLASGSCSTSAPSTATGLNSAARRCELELGRPAVTPYAYARPRGAIAPELIVERSRRGSSARSRNGAVFTSTRARGTTTARRITAVCNSTPRSLERTARVTYADGASTPAIGRFGLNSRRPRPAGELGAGSRGRTRRDIAGSCRGSSS
jgi:hypothetical protein